MTSARIWCIFDSQLEEIRVPDVVDIRALPQMFRQYLRGEKRNKVGIALEGNGELLLDFKEVVAVESGDPPDLIDKLGYHAVIWTTAKGKISVPVGLAFREKYAAFLAESKERDYYGETEGHYVLAVDLSKIKIARFLSKETWERERDSQRPCGNAS